MPSDFRPRQQIKTAFHSVVSQVKLGLKQAQRAVS
jgi:hypothetical protein